MNHEIGCAEAIRQIPFYCYGEVSSDTEERIESHLAACANCRGELARQRTFLEVVDRRAEAAETMLLAGCRNDLRLQIASAAVRPGTWLESLQMFLDFHIPFRIPVGAMALVALGWIGARYTPERFGGVRAGLQEPMFSSVQSVQPDASGKIQIAVDDVQRHVVIGSLQDRRIQELLLTAVREEANPGVREESISALENSADSAEVQRALTEAVTHDPNTGVRLKAIEGLKQYAGDAAVRSTLANVLLKDEDPDVRVQAIDLLTAHHDDSIVGVLQDVVQREDNSYIRTRCRDLLQAMKASIGTY